MGSFSVCCSVSKLSIEYEDKVALIPLIKNSELTGTSMYLSRTELFQPLCLPIIGYYDDYGCIEKVEEDENTKAIEKYFDMTIKQFLEIVTDTRHDVYDRFSPCKYLLKNIHWTESSYPFPLLLTEIGFTKRGLNMYGDIFESDYAEIGKNSDGWYVSLKSNNKYNYDFNIIKHFCDLRARDTRNYRMLRLHQAITGEYAGLKDPQKAKLCYNLGAMFALYDVYEKYSKTTKEDELVNVQNIVKSVEDYNQYKEICSRIAGLNNDAFSDKMHLVSTCPTFHPFSENDYLLPIYKNLIVSENEQIMSLFSGFYQFHKMMYLLNVMYMPMFQGSQYGAPEIELELHKLCCEILEKRLKERE